MGVLSEPLTLTIEKGRAVRIDGNDAERIIAALDATADPNAYTLAELAFGLNPDDPA